jgi:hypothetical protein
MKSIKVIALAMLVEEMALVVIAVAVTLLIFGVIVNVIAHFVFGYPWAWEIAHIRDTLLGFVIFATPALLLCGLVGMALRDEYQRIVQRIERKW